MKKWITFAVVAALTISILGFPTTNYGTDEPQVDGTTEQSGVTERSGVTEQSGDIERIVVSAAEASVPQVGRTTALKAKAVRDTAITLTWKKVEKASGYEVYKYNAKKKKYRRIRTVKRNSFRCTKLKADTKYRFKVRAYISEDGESYYGAFSKVLKSKTRKSPGQKVVIKAKKKIGAHYRSGAEGPKAFDCSGFVYWVYKNTDVKPKKKVRRTTCSELYRSLKKYKVGSSIKNIKKAKEGDIIFFARSKRMSHVAIYAGKGKLVHAATVKKGVVSTNVKWVDKSGLKVAAIVRVL